MKREHITALAVLLAGCGSPPEARTPEDVTATENGGRVEAATDAEKQVLAALDKLASDTPSKVGQQTVVARAPYLAASGQECRSVSWGAVERLACHDAQGWYFVPDVFGAAGTP